MGTQTSIAAALALAAMLGTWTNAKADASLTLTPVSSRCHSFEAGVRWGGRPGEGWVPYTQTSSRDCDPGSAGAVWIVNSRSMSIPGALRNWIEVVYDFTYTDDGLPLEGPTRFEFGSLEVQVDGHGYNSSGPGIIVAISASGDSLPPEGLEWYPPWWQPTSGAPIWHPEYSAHLGRNDHPDQISGRLTINVSVTPYATQDMAYITDIDVRGSVAAVPEPGTWALSLAGLAVFALGAWRRQRTSDAAPSPATA